MNTGMFYIRRPIGGRKYKYFSAGDWNLEFNRDRVTFFESEDDARKYMKAQKPYFGPDDNIVPDKGEYDGTFCLHCNTDGTLRVVGTERTPKGLAIFDMICTHCNTQTREEYSWDRLTRDLK